MTAEFLLWSLLDEQMKDGEVTVKKGSLWENVAKYFMTYKGWVKFVKEDEDTLTVRRSNG